MRSAKFDVEDPSGAGAVSLLTEAFRVHGVFDILPALKNRRGFLRSLVWFQPEHFRRVPVSSIGLTAPHLRRLHIGACPALGLATKELYTKTLRLIGWPIRRRVLVYSSFVARPRAGQAPK